MTRTHRFLILLALSLPIGLAQTLQPPATNPPAPPKPQVRLTIKVTNSLGEPLPGALVLASPFEMEGGPVPHTGNTKADGTITFSSIPNGSYRIIVHHHGYRTSFNRKVNVSQEGERQLTIPLATATVIKGLVTDENGDPIKGVTITPLTISGWSSGGPRYYTDGLGSTQSDASGRFLFDTLDPGRYVLLAVPKPSEDVEGFAPTYYPNGVTPLDAIPIELSPSADEPDINIKLKKRPVFNVSGSVLWNHSSGHPGPMLNLYEVGPDYNVRTPIQTTTLSGSTFKFSGVGPGDYLVSLFPIHTEGSLYFSVGKKNLPGLQLLAWPHGRTLSISGEIKVAEGKQLPESGLSKLRVWATPSHEMFVPSGMPAVKAKADGTFTLQRLWPGIFDIAVLGLPPDVYVSEIRLNGKPAKAAAVEVQASDTVETSKLEITLSLGAGQFSGSVVDSNGDPVPKAVVTLSPQRPPEPVPDLVIFCQADGTFTKGSIPPGDYFAYALATRAMSDSDPAVIQRDREHAQSVSLQPGKTQNQTLPVLR